MLNDGLHKSGLYLFLRASIRMQKTSNTSDVDCVYIQMMLINV